MWIVKRAVALCLFASCALMAQSERGNITGIVTDPSGAAIASAELSVVNRDTNAATKLKDCQLAISGPWPPYHFMPGKLRSVPNS